jgi:hypothetical protein
LPALETSQTSRTSPTALKIEENFEIHRNHHRRHRNQMAASMAGAMAAIPKPIATEKTQQNHSLVLMAGMAAMFPG